jgi:hypothetical protein
VKRWGAARETPDSNGIVRARVRRLGRVENQNENRTIESGIASASSP